MKTHSNDGQPYGTDCLLNTFYYRVVAAQELAEYATMHEPSGREKALSLALAHLRDDWDRFEAAMRAELLREDAERAAPAAEAEPR